MPKTLLYRDPDGVIPMAWSASQVRADLAREKSGKSHFHPDRVPIVLPPGEATKRAHLFLRARLGDRAAMVVLQREYRLRLIVVGSGAA